MQPRAVITCECGFEARAADEEGLVAEVRRHAAEAHCMPLSREEALLLVFHAELAAQPTYATPTPRCRRAGDAAFHACNPKEIADMNRKLTITTAALLPALALVLVVAGHAAGAESRASAPATPSATQFARYFVGVTNAYAQKHDAGAVVGGAKCVQAAPGQYMCSYLITVQDVTTCHLMQARWTPESRSGITVTLAGRTSRCGTLREAIQSLGGSTPAH